MTRLNNPFRLAADPQCAAYLAIDWSHRTNCTMLLDPSAGGVERRDVAADPASMAAFVRGLGERFGRRPIAVVTEQTKGALVSQLLDFPFVRLLAVSPLAASRFRSSLRPSGSKSDPIDADALLRMILTHGDRMAELGRGDAASRRLDALSRHRRTLVEQRVEVALRAKSLLRDSYPQALPMLGAEIWDDISLAFLRRWPAHSRLAKARDRTLERFYYANGSRSAEAVARRLESRRASEPLTSDPVVEELLEARLASLVEQLALFNRQIRQLDKRIASAFASHPDREIFESFPRAGKTMAPRLATAFGVDREAYQSCSQMQAFVGVAPIKISSGNTDCTFMRRFCPKFLRQSFHEWAGLSIQASPWAKACYEMLKDRGMRANTAKRTLAFKWMRIMFRCWKDRRPYDELRYVRALIRRRSPIVEKMKQLGFIDHENNILFA